MSVHVYIHAFQNRLSMCSYVSIFIGVKNALSLWNLQTIHFIVRFLLIFIFIGIFLNKKIWQQKQATKMILRSLKTVLNRWTIAFLEWRKQSVHYFPLECFMVSIVITRAIFYDIIRYTSRNQRVDNRFSFQHIIRSNNQIFG